MHSVVVKIGGSILFSSNSLDRLIMDVTDQYPDSSLFIVVGGGELVEAVRILHRLRPELDGERLHWKCVELLDTTWELACTIVPTAVPILTVSDLHTALANPVPSTYMVRVGCFYTEAIHSTLSEEVRPALNWNTTTDALAWLLAYTLGSDQLVIVKSCDIQENISLCQAARDEIVDGEIVNLSRCCPSIAVRFLSTFRQAE